MGIIFDVGDSSAVYQLFEKMAHFGYTFYLTGSRYFGTLDDEADWDFFVVDHKLTRGVLDHLSFYLENKTMYLDAGVTSVYKHKVLPVHIQLVDDAYIDDRIQIQRTIKNADPEVLASFSKKYYTSFWKFARALYGQGKQQRKQQRKQTSWQDVAWSS